MSHRCAARPSDPPSSFIALKSLTERDGFADQQTARLDDPRLDTWTIGPGGDQPEPHPVAERQLSAGPPAAGSGEAELDVDARGRPLVLGRLHGDDHAAGELQIADELDRPPKVTFEREGQPWIAPAPRLLTGRGPQEREGRRSIGDDRAVGVERERRAPG